MQFITELTAQSEHSHTEVIMGGEVEGSPPSGLKPNPARQGRQSLKADRSDVNTRVVNGETITDRRAASAPPHGLQTSYLYVSESSSHPIYHHSLSAGSPFNEEITYLRM